jgi:hypothetical protein
MQFSSLSLQPPFVGQKFFLQKVLKHLRKANCQEKEDGEEAAETHEVVK